MTAPNTGTPSARNAPEAGQAHSPQVRSTRASIGLQSSQAETHVHASARRASSAVRISGPIIAINFSSFSQA